MVYPDLSIICPGHFITIQLLLIPDFHMESPVPDPSGNFIPGKTEISKPETLPPEKQ